MIFQTLTILVLSLLLARHQWVGHRMHRAVRKWYQRQSALLSHEADSVRDSSLQELFALRRSLELAAIAPTNRTPEQYETWIQQLESLQASLNKFMDRLIPPFAEESLPLAVAAQLRTFKDSHSGFEFSIQRSENWSVSDPLHINKAVLAFFQGLDSEVGSAGDIASMKLAFDQAKSHKQVLIKMGCMSIENITLQQKVHDLCRMIVLLSPIDYHLTSEGHSLSLVFRWSTVEKT